MLDVQRYNPLKGLIAFVLLLFLAGCEQLTDVEHMARAVDFEKQGDYRSAIIEYKSALKLNNENVEARFALGSIYVRVGDAESARKELGIAYDKGHRQDEVRALLVQALVAAHKYQEVLDEVSDTPAVDAALSAKIYTYRGLAHLSLGDKDSATQSIERAFSIAPDSADSIFGQAYLAFAAQNTDQAMAHLNKTIELDPSHAEARLLRADIDFFQGRQKEAEAGYRHVVDHEPKNLLTTYALRGNLGLVQTLVSQKSFTEAKERVTYLQKNVPDNPMPLYFSGVIAHQEKDYAVAEDHLLKVINIVPGHKPSQLLLGAINYEQGELEQAEEYLSKYLLGDPTHIPARKLLAATRMKLRQPGLAMEALEPVMDQTGEDITTLIMAGSAAVRSGEFNVGTTYLKKAIKAMPDNAAVRTELALAYLAESDLSRALKELEKASAQSDDDVSKKANMLLILTHLKNKNNDSALNEAEKFLNKFPKDPVAYNLLGIVHEQIGNTIAAQKGFEDALVLDAKYTPALVNLARLSQRAGSLKEARERYETVLTYDASNVSVMMALSNIAQRLGDIDQAINWLEKASNSSEDAVPPRLLLAHYYLRVKDTASAQKYVNEVKLIAPEAVAVLAVQGLLDVALGENEKALEDFNKLLEKDPKSLIALYQVGVIHSLNGNYKMARESLEQVVAIAPDHLPAVSLLARLEMKDGSLKRSGKLVNEIKAQQPESYVAYVLEADYFYAQRKYKDALKLYQKAIQLNSNESLLIKIAKTQRVAGQKDVALQTLVNWLDKEPMSNKVRLVLAGELELEGKRDEAVKHYEIVLKHNPENPVVLNNLAWIYSEQGNSDALVYAEKAYKLKPRDAYILDTYGWILVKSDKLEQGVQILRKALSINDDVADIKYHLAVALVKLGAAEDARDLLQELAKNPEGLSENLDELKKMLDAL